MAKKDTRINVTLDFNAELKNVSSAISDIKKSLSGLNLPQNLNKNFLNLFSNLEAEIKNFSSLTSRELSTVGDFSAVEKSGKKILDLYRKLGVEVENLGDVFEGNKASLFPPSTKDTIDKINKAISQYNIVTSKSKKEIKDAQKRVADYTAALEIQKQKINELEKKQRNGNVVSNKDYQQAKKELEDYEAEVKKIETAFAEAQAKNEEKMAETGRTQPDKRTTAYRNMLALSNQLSEAQELLNDKRKQFNALVNESTLKSQLTTAQQKSRSLEIQLEQVNEELDKLGDGGEGEAFRRLVDSLKDIDGIDSNALQNVEDVQLALEKIYQKGGREASKALEKVRQALNDASPAAKDFGDKTNDASQSIGELTRQQQDIDNLKNRIFDFFSITNAVQLFKRAVNSAVDTVKELDATMTEAAVVTEFSIGDMWDKLPQYSEEASKLGVRINDLYGATTLYYQQGLKTNDAMGVGVETMKMAAVANMEATEATEAMTAALRGFNMEVNETNAQVVNDVYSELAAITAADTNQIATAMSKTASIASAANMEFETTAALLAQIIETTQEAPETAGTAMKTIIARFTEVKELFNQGQLTGEDDEGEVIEINKIDTALKSVGISLKDFLTGTKGIDDIFLELASKWDSLDLSTQRYIATQAAGSRQQSRFLAMMGNYDRTMELVNAANNSAGASAEQFAKTADSLESKLNNLKNAWDQFAMGLANQELIKGGVDLLTNLLNIANKLIDALSGESGLAKTLISIGGIAGGLKLGKGLLAKVGLSSKKDSPWGNLSKLIPEVKEGSFLAKGYEIGRNFGLNLSQGIKNGFGAFDLTQLDFSQANFNSILGNQAKIKISQQLVDLVEAGKIEEDQAKGFGQLANSNFNQAISKYPEIAKLINLNAKELKALEIQIDKDIVKTQSWGNILSILGIALQGLAKILPEIGVSDRVTESVSALGTGLMFIPGILSVIKTAAEATGHAMTASMGAWGIAIGAVIAIISALVSYIETPAEKLERLKEETARAGEMADASAEAYNNLKSSLDNLDGAEKTLDDCIKGTQEWRDALWEVNNQVLDLIERFPQLAGSATVDSDGKYVIDPQTLEGLKQQLEEGRQNAQQAKLISAAKEEAGILSNSKRELSLGREKHFDQIAEWVQKNPGAWIEDEFGNLSPALEEFADELGIFPPRLAELAKSISDFSDKAKIAEKTIQSNLELAIQTDLGDTKNPYQDQITKGTAKRFASNLDDRIEAEIEKIKKEGLNSQEQLEKQYADLSKISLKDIQDKNYKQDELQALIAEVRVGNQAAEEANRILAQIRDKDTPENRIAAAVYSEDFSGLTREQMNRFIEKGEDSSVFSKEEILSALETIGIDTDEEKAAFLKDKGFENIDEYVNYIAEIWQATADEFGEVHNAVSKENQALTKSATRNQTLQTSQDIVQVYDNAEDYGSDAVNEIDSIIGTNGELRRFVASDSDEFKQIVELMSNLDFNSVNDIETFSEQLKEIAPNIPNEVLEEWIGGLKSAYGALKTYNLANLFEDSRTTLNFIDEIQSKEDNIFSIEDYEKYLKEGLINSEDFIFDGQNYLYVADSMWTLKTSLDELKTVVAKDTQARLREEIGVGEKTARYFEKNRFSAEDILSYENFKDADLQRGALERIFGSSIIDVATGESREIDTLTDDELHRIYGQVFESYRNLEANQERVEQYNPYAEYESGQDIIGSNPGKDTKLKQQALDNVIAQEGLQVALEETREQFEETNNIISENALKALTIDSVNLEKKLNKLNKTVNDFDEALKNPENALEYNEALNEIANQASETFGVEITPDFVNTHIEQFQAMAQGSEEAYLQISAAAATAFAEQAGLAESLVTEVENSIANGDFTIEANGTGDFSDIFNNFVANKNLTMEQAEELAKYIGLTLGGTTSLRQIGNKYIKVATGYDYITGAPTGYTEKPVPMYALEFKQGKTPSSPRSGGGGSSKSSDHWENPYDEQYNTHQKVDETLRERNSLEREYDRLLESRDVSAEKLLENSAKQLNNLRQELELQQKLQKAELRHLEEAKNYDYLASNGDDEYWTTFQKEATKLGMGDLDEWASYNPETGEITIDQARIEALEDDTKKGEEQGTLIEAYISYLEEQSDAYEEATDRLDEIADEVQEIRRKAMEDYLTFEQRVYDALVAEQQAIIDNAQELSDTLSDANSSILDSLQESIDLERQIRDNTEQEEDIADMEARLAYLRRDTSGANQQEIRELEEELADARESYGDTLVDQEIERMTSANEKAQEQRERQIEIAQAQLDYAAENGMFWERVEQLLEEAVKADDLNETELARVLGEVDGVKAMSQFGTKNWMYELAQEFALAGLGLSNWKVEEAELQGTLSAGQVVNEEGTSVGDLTYNKEIATWTDSSGGTYKTLEWDEENQRYTASGYTAPVVDTPETEDSTSVETPSGNSARGKIASVPNKLYSKLSTTEIKNLQTGLNDLIKDGEITGVDSFSSTGNYKSKTTSAVKKLQGLIGTTQDGKWGPNTYEAFKKSRLKAYKTGGIADFTGPAWLDGTKSKPEIILNQQDSKNFIILKDVLSEILQGATSTKGGSSGGDNYFDISIVVDEISSDYDVDQMAARIKQQIYDDSTYRNVNSINLIR